MAPRANGAAAGLPPHPNGLGPEGPTGTVGDGSRKCRSGQNGRPPILAGTLPGQPDRAPRSCRRAKPRASSRGPLGRPCCNGVRAMPHAEPGTPESHRIGGLSCMHDRQRCRLTLVVHARQTPAIVLVVRVKNTSFMSLRPLSTYRNHWHWHLGTPFWQGFTLRFRRPPSSARMPMAGTGGNTASAAIGLPAVLRSLGAPT